MRGMLKASLTPRRWPKFIAYVLGGCLLAYALLVLLVRPSTQRHWSPDQAQMARAEFNYEQVRIQNIRNAEYRSSGDYEVHWETRSYDLKALESVWLIVEPFADWRGPAHTFLSFGFHGGEYLGVSVEIRKQRGESFSPLRGLFRQYELSYVVADERDLIGLRANHRQHDVYLYKMRATPEQIRVLLRDMLTRANQLTSEPEFYHTLTNTCSSNIVSHINRIAPGRIPFSFSTLLPAYADDFSYDLGLIETELPRDTYRAAHRINALAEKYADSAHFSRAIRGLE